MSVHICWARKSRNRSGLAHFLEPRFVFGPNVIAVIAMDPALKFDKFHRSDCKKAPHLHQQEHFSRRDELLCKTRAFRT
eukprot:1151777-Amphidinium_carterae.1